MAEAKKMEYSVIENILPPEVIEKILKLLSLKDICQARLICRRLKEIVEKGIILKKTSGRIPDIFKLHNFCTIVAGGSECYNFKHIYSKPTIFSLEIIIGDQRIKNCQIHLKKYATHQWFSTMDSFYCVEVRITIKIVSN